MLVIIVSPMGLDCVPIGVTRFACYTPSLKRNNMQNSGHIGRNFSKNNRNTTSQAN